ncbi:annexin A5-like isoform X1 [Lytechinus pictus]|uniref:annexin A5-like isoform X1 n=1 Tax=Lytechinus pictus TaxID=7653 RepID=UPI0030BA02DA
MGQTESSSSGNAGAGVTGTITPANPFDKDADATALYEAMAGFGTDEEAINAILTKRSNGQRQEIKEAFKLKYEKELVDCLKDELSGDYRKTINAMMAEPPVMIARCIKEICECGGDEMEKALLEIIYPLNPNDVLAIAAAYKETFTTDLTEDVMKADDKGAFKNVIGNILVGERSTSVFPNMVQAADDAAYFFKTIPEDWQLPNERVEELFGKASIAQLSQTFAQANAQFQANKQSLETVVKGSKMAENQKAAFSIIFESIHQPILFYADSLYYAMKGLGTNDDKLIRIVVGRSEIDLASIKVMFMEKHATPLATMVTDDTSGDYKNVLLGIINANETATTQSTTN